jgi:hypothetical protein
MQNSYEARWITRPRADKVRRTGASAGALLLDTSNGIIIVQPSGSDLGDGPRLTRAETEYELQAAWYLGPLSKLRQARNLLGLEAEERVAITV